MTTQYRRDDLPVNHRTDAQLQDDALRRLRAEAAAQAVLDREAAERDYRADRTRRAVHTRPAAPPSASELARVAMIRRTSPRYTPPSPAAPEQDDAVQRFDAAQHGTGIAPGTGSAAAARALMLRRARG